MLQSVAELYERCGGPARVGRAIGVSTPHAGQFMRRGSLPSGYWVALVEWAAAEGIADVTYEALARLHAKPAPAEADPQPAGAPQ